VLIGAFLHGWVGFGWTDWAFVNRTVGWFMLLAYGATGAVIVTCGGERGFLILLRTFVAAGLAVVALDTAFFTITSAGITLPSQIVNLRLEGFAQNPNAFALQILLIMSAAVAFRGARGHNLVLSLAVLGLCLSQSRAGWLAFAVAVPAMLLLRAVKPSQLLVACAITALASVVLNWLPQIIDAIMSLLLPIGNGWSSPTVAPFTDAASRYGNSDSERMASFLGGWQLFLEHPIFGAGLGAFIDAYTEAHGSPLIIHSTPLWLAAEMGIVGFVAFALPFLRIFVQEVSLRSDRSPARAVLIVSLIAFGVMSLAHEVLYQRALWVLWGAALACPPARPRPPPIGRAGPTRADPRLVVAP
jgi:O-antigen ligase